MSTHSTTQSAGTPERDGLSNKQAWEQGTPHKCGSLTNATYGQSWAGCGLPDAPEYRTTMSTEPKGSSRGNAKHTWLPPTKRRQDVLEHKNQTNNRCCLRGLSFPVLFLLNCFYQWAFITSSLQQLIQWTPRNISTALPFSGQEVGDSGGEKFSSRHPCGQTLLHSSASQMLRAAWAACLH